MILIVFVYDLVVCDKLVGCICQKNEEVIFVVVEEEFVCYGFKGISMNIIVQNVGLFKVNLYYYFGNKLGFYMVVLSNIFEFWDSIFNIFGVDDDLVEVLVCYICVKMEFFCCYLLVLWIFVMEIISGGECFIVYFNQDYCSWFCGCVVVFEVWIVVGWMDLVDFVYLIFLFWGSIQYYVDFVSQIGLVIGCKCMFRQDFVVVVDNLVWIIFKGCGLILLVV